MKRENVVSKCLDYEIKAIKRQTRHPQDLAMSYLYFHVTDNSFKVSSRVKNSLLF